MKTKTCETCGATFTNRLAWANHRTAHAKAEHDEQMTAMRAEHAEAMAEQREATREAWDQVKDAAREYGANQRRRRRRRW